MSNLLNYAPLISAIATVGMLIVWLSYFQILLTYFKHSRRSSILITRGKGRGLDAECVIGNMSASCIYVYQVFIKIETDTETLEDTVTDIRQLLNQNEDAIAKAQSPLNTGDTMTIATFKTLVDMMLRQKFGPDWDTERYSEVRAIEVTVVANFSTYQNPVGARRRFTRVLDDGVESLVPYGVSTEQMRSKRDSRNLMETIDER